MRKIYPFIILNQIRYKPCDLKLIKKLNLNNFTFTTREKNSRNFIDIGASTNDKYGKRWYLINGKKAIFKTFNYSPFTDMRSINEVLYPMVAEKMLLPCAKTEFATCEDRHGIVSYSMLEDFIAKKPLHSVEYINSIDVLNHNEISYSCKNTLSSYRSAIENLFQYEKNCVDTEKIMLELYRLSVCYLLTMQEDNNLNNIKFAYITYTDGTKDLQLLPSFDHEFAFGTYTYLISKCRHWAFMTESLLKHKFINSSLNCDNRLRVEHECAETYDEAVEYIIMFAKTHIAYKNVLKQAIKGYNLPEALNNLQKRGVTLTKEQIKWYTFNYDISKSTFIKIYKQVFENENQNAKDMSMFEDLQK